MEEDDQESQSGSGPEGPAGAPQLSEEEIAMLEQQMRELRMEDVLTQTVVSVLNLTARRIAKDDEMDLEQARLGIEAVRALMPLLPEDVSKEIRDPLSQIQVLYARKSGEEGGETEGRSDQGQGPDAPDAGGRQGDSGLWTPPGT